MAGPQNNPLNASTTTPDLAELAETVAQTARFRKAPVLQELLLFLVKNHDSDLSEYAIGIDALGRKADFDPKIDATVRVQVGRLRQRLKDYYDDEGKFDPVRLVVPRGSYRLTMERQALEPVPGEGKKRSRMRALLAGLAALGVLSIALAIDNWRLRNLSSAPNAGTQPAAGPIWEPFVQGKLPLTLVIPSPLFFHWQKERIVVRDFGVNDPERFSQSKQLVALGEKFGGEPEVSQLYTVASDTLAGAEIAGYLHRFGVKLQTLGTSTLSLDALREKNSVIFVGPGSFPELEPLFQGSNFYLVQGDQSVLNRQPLRDEPAKWLDRLLAPGHNINHGIISRMPGKSAGTYMLVLAGRFNSGLSTMLTSEAEMEQVVKLYRANGSPEYFEMVVRYERNAERILKANPVAFRAFRPVR
jgi:hypothetical protein